MSSIGASEDDVVAAGRWTPQALAPPLPNQQRADTCVAGLLAPAVLYARLLVAVPSVSVLSFVTPVHRDGDTARESPTPSLAAQLATLNGEPDSGDASALRTLLRRPRPRYTVPHSSKLPRQQRTPRLLQLPAERLHEASPLTESRPLRGSRAMLAQLTASGFIGDVVPHPYMPTQPSRASKSEATLRPAVLVSTTADAKPTAPAEQPSGRGVRHRRYFRPAGSLASLA